MRRFAELVRTLGSSTKTNDKLNALVDYFEEADERDKVWVIAIFSGRRPKRVVSSSLLMEYCIELTGFPSWLFEECYHTVGDLGRRTRRPHSFRSSLPRSPATAAPTGSRDRAVRTRAGTE